MLNNMKKYLAIGQISIPLVSSLLIFSNIAIAGAQPALSYQEKSLKGTKVQPKVNLPLGNGVYLYGQSPKPNQIGQGYIVFEKRQNNVVGAMYMPQSEFSCFKGTIDPSGELAMTVTGYPGDVGPTRIATSSTVPRINDTESVIYDHSLALQNFYALKTVSAGDRRILQICKTTAQQ